VWPDAPRLLRFGDDRLRVIAVYGLSGRAAAGQTNGDNCSGRITVFVGATRWVALDLGVLVKLRNNFFWGIALLQVLPLFPLQTSPEVAINHLLLLLCLARLKPK